MNVILDVMPFGAALNSPHGRTGIFRVTDRLAKGLLSRKDISLSYIASQFGKEAAMFLEEDKEYKTGLSYPTKADTLLEKIRNRVKRHTGIALPLPPGNLARLAAGSDIYHSTYMPVPHDIKQVKRLSAFLTVHDLIPIFFPQYFEHNHDPLVKSSIKSIQDEGFVFCVSEATKNDLCNYCPIDPERIFVTRLAADPGIFYPVTDGAAIETVKERYSIGIEPYLLSVCTLEPRKNVEQTIRSFVQLVSSERISDLNLVLIGSKGWDFDRIFREIGNAESVKNRIKVTGFVSDNDLAFLYSGAQGFVYPSFYEGFGLPPLEAMQCGTPVITSNTSSLPEVVGDAAITISPTDGDALSQAMLDMYSSTELRKTMSEKSLLQAAKFSWTNFINDTLRGYNFALNPN